MFFRRKERKLTLCIVYVDDIVVTGNDHEGIHQLKEFLGEGFEIKDLGQLRYSWELK